jgi:hypothetical protein
VNRGKELQGPEQRGRSRPRFRASGLAASVVLLALAGCGGYELGLPDLPSIAGWQQLPLRNWVMNEELGPARIVYCQPRFCVRPAVVATLTAQGQEATRLMRSLADPQALLRAKRYEVAVARDPRFKRKTTDSPRKSGAHAEPIEAGGLKGYRVTLSPSIAGGHAAYAVVLARPEADRAQVALAITTDPDAALQEALAAAKSF